MVVFVMIFDFDLEIPLSTPKESPVTSYAVLTLGTLTRIAVKFPPGPAGLVYVVVKDRLHQIMPANSEGSLNYDSETIVDNLEYPINEPPYRLALVGWSPNTLFNHVIRFQFHMIPAGGSNWQVFLRQLFG